MKKKQNIRILLGMSQEDLALILQVSRSQIAMYELGKRSLPVDAMEKLTVMLSVVQNNTSIAMSKDKISNFEQTFLKNKLLKNKHHQLIVEKRINALLKKQSAINASKQIISHLLNKNSNIKKNEIAFLKNIEAKTQNKTAQNNAVTLLQLELKKEILVFEEKLIQKKLQFKN